MKSERELRNEMNRRHGSAKSGLDRLDLEAEAEGGARRFFNMNDLKPQLGRRISKEGRKAEGVAKTAANRATINIVKDTAAVYNSIVVKQRDLRAVP
jgi:hypothetical protein